MRRDDQAFAVSFPKPKRVVTGAIVVTLGLWVLFASLINWGKSGDWIFGLFVGSDDILRGQIWRLFTNFLVHTPSGPGAAGHIIMTALGLYFLGPSLEERWGSRRLLVFMLSTGVFGSTLQLLLGALIAPLHQQPFYGALGIIDGIAIAWAMSFRDQQVRLFFVLPVSGRGLMFFVVAVNVLYLIALSYRPEGLVTPFGGMLAGWIFAEGSPLRRRYLQWKLRRIQARVATMQPSSNERAARLGLRVIEGGTGGGKGKVDKSMLN